VGILRVRHADIAPTAKTFASVYQAAKASGVATAIKASAMKGERLAARFFKC